MVLSWGCRALPRRINSRPDICGMAKSVINRSGLGRGLRSAAARPGDPPGPRAHIPGWSTGNQHRAYGRLVVHDQDPRLGSDWSRRAGTKAAAHSSLPLSQLQPGVRVNLFLNFTLRT
jgi:hypothetical protein